jgi:hypothetical protein
MRPFQLARTFHLPESIAAVLDLFQVVQCTDLGMQCKFLPIQLRCGFDVKADSFGEARTRSGNLSVLSLHGRMPLVDGDKKSIRGSGSRVGGSHGCGT